MHERIRVLIAEDNADLASAVRELLNGEDDLEVVGVIDDASSLACTVGECEARVVVLDLNLSGGSSVPAMQAVRRDRPGIGVVVFSGYDRADVAAALPALGDVEFVSKSGNVAELVDAVRRAAGKTAAAADR